MFLISLFLCENYKTHTHGFITVEDRVAFIKFNGDNATGINF